MREIKCEHCGDLDIKAYCWDHFLNLWEEWAYGFHSEWQKSKLWEVSILENKIIHVYVMIQKYQELYNYYKISKIDKTIENGIQDFLTELITLIKNSRFTENNYLKVYRDYTYIPYYNISNIEKLKCKIEGSKTVSKLNAYIMNIKSGDYLKKTSIKRKDFEAFLYTFYLYDDSSSMLTPKRKLCRHDHNSLLKDKIEKENIDHWNRNIKDELIRKEQEIIDLKTENDIKLAKLIEEKDCYCQKQIEQYKKEKSSEVALRIENIHKELDYMRNSHIKEKNELNEEIKELRAKINNFAQSAMIENKNKSETNTDLPYNEEEQKNISDEDITIVIDWSKKDDYCLLENNTEYNAPISLTIMNVSELIENKLFQLNLFLERWMTTKWEKFTIQSNGKSKAELYNFIESLSIVLPNISKEVCIQGFDIDFTSLKQLFESIYNTQSFSLLDWCIDIKSPLKFDSSSQYKLKNLEFKNIITKEWSDSLSIESKAKILSSALDQSSFFNHIEKLNIDKNTVFEQSFYYSIPNKP